MQETSGNENWRWRSHHRRIGLLAPALLGLLLGFPQGSSAQITPDSSLPNPSTVRVENDIIEIDAGTTVGNNLFHSFSEFSVPIGTQASFNNATGIDNVLTRVTGLAASEINGLIQVNGTANLFILNPNGIVFGPEASLDLGGAFVATTASSLQFADGTEFSAIASETAPILTVSVPVGLQFGDRAEPVTVQGPGNGVFVDLNTFSLVLADRPEGLAVAPQQTLALVGGPISLEGGNLTAESGRIELGSVAPGEQVVLQTADDGGLALDFAPETTFNDILFTEGASIDVSGDASGTARLQGNNIAINDGSAVLGLTFGAGGSGALSLEATGTIEVVGESPITFLQSIVSADSGFAATGPGANVNIASDRLLLSAGGQITSTVFGAGPGGPIAVSASEIELVGESPAVPSGLFASVEFDGTGNGGGIAIATETLQVTEGAQIASLVFGLGNAGPIAIDATTIEIVSSDLTLLGDSGIFATTEEAISGNAGNIFITTEQLRLLDGAQILTSSAGIGDAGAIEILADNIEAIGSNAFSRSTISTGTVDGLGGTLSIQTEQLQVSDGAQIAAATSGSGDAGSLTVSAMAIELLGTTPDEIDPSGFFATSIGDDATGNAGTLTVEAEELLVADGAQIIANSFGAGDAGAVNIQADRIELIGGTSTGPSLISAATSGDGQGGVLQIETGQLSLVDGAQITATTFGSGAAGDLTVIAQDITLSGGVAQGQSALAANALDGSGAGGSITVETGTLSLLDGGTIVVGNFPTADSGSLPGSGPAGDLSITAQSVQLAEGGLLSADTVTGTGANITLSVAENLTLDSSSQISTNATETGQGGSITIAASGLQLSDESAIAANATNGAGNIALQLTGTDGLLLQDSQVSAAGGQGNLAIVAPSVTLEGVSLLQTNGLGTEPGGNITIDTDFIVAAPSPAPGSDITANAEQSLGGQVDITASALFNIFPQAEATPSNDITATSALGSEFNGIIEVADPVVDPTSVLVVFDTNTVDVSTQVVASCQKLRGNELILTGRGGVPRSPVRALGSQPVWNDFRLAGTLASESARGSAETDRAARAIAPAAPAPQQAPLIEARGWQKVDGGEMVLVAQQAVAPTFHDPQAVCNEG